MAYPSELPAKAAEFHSFFRALDENKQENIINILKALEFAQSVVLQPEGYSGPSKGYPS